MKKLVLVFIAFLSLSTAIAQKTPISARPGDHIMLQLSSDQWTGEPDSVKSHIKGLSRGANIYVMMDKPFKNSPRFSVAFGIGIGTSSIFFKNESIDVKSLTSYLPFHNLDTLDHFKKYKVASSFLEVPVELRFSSNPENDGKSIKIAIGAKVGTLLNAHTKGKSPENKSSASINSYTEKESSKRFFNSTRIAATARIGYGHFSLYGSYQVNSIFKTGVAADTKLIQIGFCISGL